MRKPVIFVGVWIDADANWTPKAVVVFEDRAVIGESETIVLHLVGMSSGAQAQRAFAYKRQMWLEEHGGG